MPLTWEDRLTQEGYVLIDGVAQRGLLSVPSPRPGPHSPPEPHVLSEDEEQRALFAWRRAVLPQEPLLDLLHHIPNGKQRSKAVAGQLKALGVKAGMPDLFLPVARHGYHGLYIEQKTLTGTTTALQRALHLCLRDEGYAVEVCKGWVGAAGVLCWYLNRADLARHLE